MEKILHHPSCVNIEHGGQGGRCVLHARPESRASGGAGFFPSTDSDMKILRDALGGIENLDWRWEASLRFSRNGRARCECCAGCPERCLISHVTSSLSTRFSAVRGQPIRVHMRCVTLRWMPQWTPMEASVGASVDATVDAQWTLSGRSVDA